MITESAPWMARGSAAIDCGRAIQVPERQSTFYRRATRPSIDYSKPFAVQLCLVQVVCSLFVGLQQALRFALLLCGNHLKVPPLLGYRGFQFSDCRVLFRPIVGEESDECGIITESGEDVAWDEAWESRWTWE